jgi:hypothetical protein
MTAELLFKGLEAYVTEGWKVVAAEEAKNVILELTAEGKDADGNTLHAYSDSHASVRQSLGLQVGRKDLRMGQLGLLPSLEPRRIGGKLKLAVADNAGDKLNKVAHGQMYHPAWSYHHKFLAVGDEMRKRVHQAVVGRYKRAK